MTLEEFEKIIRGITYKPGTRITYYEEMHYVEVRVRLIVDDVLCHTEKTTITMTDTIRRADLHDMNAQKLLRFVWSMILRLEKHEIDEFFKYEGVCVNDPHPN